MHVKAMRKGKGCALLHMGCHIVVVDLRNLLIGQQNHHHVCGLDRIVDFHDIQAGLAHFVPRCAAFAQSNHHFDATVVEVLGVCMSL